MEYYFFNIFLWEADFHDEKRADNKKFNEALAKVITDPAFDPEAMGDHMAEELGISRGATNNPRGRAIERCVLKARSIQEYFEDL